MAPPFTLIYSSSASWCFFPLPRKNPIDNRIIVNIAAPKTISGCGSINNICPAAKIAIIIAAINIAMNMRVLVMENHPFIYYFSSLSCFLTKFNYTIFSYFMQLLRYSVINSSISPFITASTFPTS